MLIQDNNAKELEVTDQGSAMAYCSLAINVGSFNNPSKRQGLAHFLEHMIFMGSEKYPEENSYNEHISMHGGECNAYTEFEWTNFYLNVDYSGLQTTLDMLASAFHKPKLAKGAVKREMNAVESEF